MGYESKLFIVEKCGLDVEKGMRYGVLVAMLDLCGCPAVSDRMRRYEKTDTFFYTTGAEEPVVEDLYGEPLKEIPLADAIKIVREAAENDEYRRFKPCLSLLEGFEPEKWKELVVLHYGH